MLKWLYGGTICLSALLLFIVQPLLAKVMLPFFGGSAFVWIASILFFQIGLLLGYSYAFLQAKYFSEKTQAVSHIIFIALAFSFIPLKLHSSYLLNDLWPPL